MKNLDADSRYSNRLFLLHFIVSSFLFVFGLYLIYVGYSARETFGDGLNIGIGLLLVKIASDTLYNLINKNCKNTADNKR